MNASIFFQGGTLVLDHSDDIEHVPALFQFVKGRWRCEAYHYHEVLPWIQERGIRNAIPRRGQEKRSWQPTRSVTSTLQLLSSSRRRVWSTNGTPF